MISAEEHDRIIAAKDAQVAALEARPRVCVVGLITDPADRLLLIKHRKRGGWELPGGKHDRGETWREAMRREMREETGLTVDISTRSPDVLDGVPVGGAGYYSVILVAHCRAEGEPVPGDDAEDARWFSRDEIPWGDLSKIGSAVVVKRWADTQSADEDLLAQHLAADCDRMNEREAAQPIQHGTRSALGPEFSTTCQRCAGFGTCPAHTPCEHIMTTCPPCVRCGGSGRVEPWELPDGPGQWARAEGPADANGDVPSVWVSRPRIGDPVVRRA